MRRKYLYPILIISITIGFYYIEEYQDGNWIASEEHINNESNTSFYYLPTSTTGTIIMHTYYSLSYSEKHEQAEWVAYQLKKEHLSKNNFKRPYFEQDKKIHSSSADWRNYKNSGYDRGHLCPAGDRRFSYKAFEETFLTSNVTPQDHEFNSRIWNSLEKKVRHWANIYNGVYVVTGGVLSDDLETIGYEAVSIPKYFYKIILDTTAKHPKMIAFLIPHKNTNRSLEEFVVSVDEIERLTGIDFFSKMEDTEQERLESSLITENWKF
ncbi:DNA/RNA non-specific endonuclease [Aquimarina sp. U1-2]|uniref:DNA/RNA non-specific endonuclease n=1 Tax=Aquimarina sp. U1-2 TaxID=2823141 RepID=UPI001AECE5B1|nr:DNA/RNA non-specific endonuclease [Aquimarina sp. U1-2]MBP2832580.1 DNA/RNA non-specific endonuclease [Aquimarina sp. U1-2]